MSPRLRRVDAVQVADAFAALGILADRHVDPAAVEDGRGDAVVARLRPDGVLGVQVELPERRAGPRVERVEPAVAAREDHLHHAIDLAERGRRPLAVQDAIARRAVLPDHLAGQPIDGQEARRARRGQLALARRRRPFEVSTKTRSSQTTGDELAMLCGDTPSSFIMSSFHTTSASCGPLRSRPERARRSRRRRSPRCRGTPVRRGS